MKRCLGDPQRSDSQKDRPRDRKARASNRSGPLVNPLNVAVAFGRHCISHVVLALVRARKLAERCVLYFRCCTGKQRC